jgi:hypothetical protein
MYRLCVLVRRPQKSSVRSSDCCDTNKCGSCDSDGHGIAMVTGGDADAAPAMATEAEGSVRATPDAPDADVVMAAHGS